MTQPGRPGAFAGLEDISPRRRTLVAVPAVLIESFRANPRRALRDLAAVPGFAVDPWDPDGPLRRDEVSRDRYHPGGEVGVPDPEDPERTWYFASDWVCTAQDTAPRWIHVDLALSRDACGMAMVHPKPVYIEFPVRAGGGGSERRPYMVADLMLRIAAPPGGQIVFEGVRERIREISYRGFSVAGISYDGWQSIDSQQILSAAGYHTEECSVDRTLEPYECLLEYMRLGAMDYYEYEPFLAEWERLQLMDGKKVDHLPGGSKDVADAVAGATWMATQRFTGEGELLFA